MRECADAGGRCWKGHVLRDGEEVGDSEDRAGGRQSSLLAPFELESVAGKK